MWTRETQGGVRYQPQTNLEGGNASAAAKAFFLIQCVQGPNLTGADGNPVTTHSILRDAVPSRCKGERERRRAPQSACQLKVAVCAGATSLQSYCSYPGIGPAQLLNPLGISALIKDARMWT